MPFSIREHISSANMPISLSHRHDDRRGKEILEVFDRAFGNLIKEDPSAINTKFRKMSASAFAFYRGTACLFYHDQKKGMDKDPFLDDKTSRVWVHGDLHAENFGTYMDSRGCLVFNVNDFDEAYLGPFTWDLKRFAASIALIGYDKALSDKQIADLVRRYARAYRERIHVIATSKNLQEEATQFTLGSAEGPILQVLRSARLQSRAAMLDSMTDVVDAERRFSHGGGAVVLDAETREKVVKGYNQYLETLPSHGERGRANRRIKDVIGRRGVGIGSAGLPSYNILLEGRSEALENDVVLYMKQAQSAAISEEESHIVAQKHFKHEGHRTVLSQRALQAHADQWLGWAEIDGVGYLVAEIAPYETDLEWSDINKPSEIASVVADLGRATAMMHGAGDDDQRHSDLVPFSPEKVIDAVIADTVSKFEDGMVDFALEYGSQTRNDHHIFVDLFRNGKIPGMPNSDDLE